MKDKVNVYRITGNKVTHMKLNTIELSDNETLSMLKRYNFNDDYAVDLLEDIQKNMDELCIKQEQKEYEEMNYSAICKKLYNRSTWDLVKQICDVISSLIRLA